MYEYNEYNSARFCSLSFSFCIVTNQVIIILCCSKCYIIHHAPMMYIMGARDVY